MPKGAWAQSPVTVGDEGFSTIQEAINHIVDDGLYDATLTLHQDFTLEDVERIDISFESGSEYFNITIDLNGHTITGGCEWSTNAIEFYNHGEGLPTVTIANSCQDKKGKLFNCHLELNPNTKVIVKEGVSIYPSSELLESCYIVFYINSETSSVENYGDIYGEVMVGPGGSFINNGSVAYVNGEFENNGGYCAYFNWADDGSSFRVFAYDGVVYDYNEWDEDTSITSEVTKEPTCTEPGVRTVTGAVFFGGQEFTDTKEVEIAIDPNAHDYHVQLDEDNNPVFVWSENYTTATLQVVCSRDTEHTANVEVTGEGITSEDTTPATCTTAGVRIYTAKATYEGVEYTGTKEVEISAAGHSFVDGVCEVCHATAVAEVMIGETTTGYTDIQEAFDAAMAATGEVTVKLLADVTLTEFENNLDRGEEANRYDVALTLDLNGHNVTGNTSQAVIYVTSITLKITDEGKTGSINNCRLVVFKSDIYVDEDVTLRAEKLDWDLVNLEEDCSLENHGILYGIVVYGSGTAFYNDGLVAYAQNMGGCFENGGSFIPIWSWDTDWETDEIYCEVYINNEKLYSSKDGTVELSSEVTKAPTCTESGERTYTAAIEYVGKTYTDTYSVNIDIDPEAHDFTSKTLTAEPDEHGLYAYACDREGCEGHSDYNVVKGNGEGNNIELIATTDSETGITTYSAESVIIEDGKPFYSPVEFTTRDVDMGRQFTQSIGDAVVPATIMLPFRMYAGEVSTVNPQGVRTGTKFYSFTSLDYNSYNDRWEANMDIVIDDLEAYTPYMVVLTDGEEIPFGNAPVTFTQTPAEMNNITSSDGEWSFVATNEAKVWTAADFGHGEAYYGFAAGNETTPEGKFVKVGTGASIDPLRAYIMKNVQTRGSASNAPSRALTASQLPSTIGVRLNETYATGIGTLNTETGEFTFDGWYDLQGRRISEPVKNGISIKNDKKILVK